MSVKSEQNYRNHKMNLSIMACKNVQNHLQAGIKQISDFKGMPVSLVHK